MRRRVVDWLDRWVERHEKIQPIGGGGYILRLRMTSHRGPRLVLMDGTVVDRGDLVGELHLDNHLAATLHAEGSGGFRFRHEILRLLPALALDLETRPEYRAINAIYGASLFWRSASLAAKAGFESRPLPPFTRWWLGTWERILLATYHPEGQRRLGKGRRTELRQVWITRRTLARFIERATASASQDGSPGVAPDPERGAVSTPDRAASAPRARLGESAEEDP